MSLKKQIQENKHLSEIIMKIWNDYSNQQSEIILTETNKKEFLFVNIFYVSLEYYKSIICLIDNGHYNTAYAMIRVLFESVVRGYYIGDCLDEKKQDELLAGKDKDIFPSMKEICCLIDKKLNIHYFKKAHKFAWKSMNGYTHTGFIQIRSVINDKTSEIGSISFSSDDIINTLKISNELMTIFSSKFCKITRCENFEIINKSSKILNT